MNKLSNVCAVSDHQQRYRYPYYQIDKRWYVTQQSLGWVVAFLQVVYDINISEYAVNYRRDRQQHCPVAKRLNCSVVDGIKSVTDYRGAGDDRYYLVEKSYAVVFQHDASIVLLTVGGNPDQFSPAFCKAQKQ